MTRMEFVPINEALSRLIAIGFSAEHRSLLNDPFGAIFAVRKDASGRFAMAVPLVRAGIIRWPDVTDLLAFARED